MSDSFAGGEVKVLVQDKVWHPVNPRRLHYRFQALADASAEPQTINKEQATTTQKPTPENENETTPKIPKKHIHIDLDATLHDTTADIGQAHCEIELNNGEGIAIFSLPNTEAHALLGEDGNPAKLLIADCVNRNNEVVYGIVTDDQDFKPSQGSEGRINVKVSTKFASDMDKLALAFSSYKMQTYAGPTPIQNSKHLDYMKEINADAGEFYEKLNKEFKRTNPLDENENEASNLRRHLDETEVSVGATPLVNCEQVGDCTVCHHARFFVGNTVLACCIHPSLSHALAIDLGRQPACCAHAAFLFCIGRSSSGVN